MDLIRAIEMALLVQETEAVAPGELKNAAGKTINIAYGATSASYKVITTVYGNDLATDENQDQNKHVVSFGFVLQAPNNDVVIALRGTGGIWEWLDDAKFLSETFPFVTGAGRTEDGFTEIYKSLRISDDSAAPRVVNCLARLPLGAPVGSVTICGHSLGGALATLLALDVAANTAFKNPTAFTYASPRAGDAAFAGAYNQAVPDTFRIANRKDIVPKLPMPPFYEHVLGLSELTPGSAVKMELACQHHLTSYLYLLSQLANQTAPANPILPPDGACIPCGKNPV